MEHEPPAAYRNGGHEEEIEIALNERPVTIFGRRHTGLDVKKAAVAQGIPIGLDFTLGVIHPGLRQPAPVDDSEMVSIAPDTRFVASPGRGG